MTLDDYQNKTGKTAVYPGQKTFLGLLYTSLKLNGEAGEVAEKVGKIMRDANSVVDPRAEGPILLELGDVLWYVARIADELGYNLSYEAELNLNKIASRQARGAISGSGDDR